MTRKSRQQAAPCGPTRETATTTTKMIPAAKQYRPPTYHQCGAWSDSLSLMKCRSTSAVTMPVPNGSKTK